MGYDKSQYWTSVTAPQINPVDNIKGRRDGETPQLFHLFFFAGSWPVASKYLWMSSSCVAGRQGWYLLYSMVYSPFPWKQSAGRYRDHFPCPCPRRKRQTLSKKKLKSSDRCTIWSKWTLPQYRSAALWSSRTCHLVESAEQMTKSKKWCNPEEYVHDAHQSSSWTHISVQREVSLRTILSCDDAVSAVHASDHRPLKLLRSHNLHGHNWLQDDAAGLFHGWEHRAPKIKSIHRKYKVKPPPSGMVETTTPCLTAPSPARMKAISLESTMWWAPSSRRNLTPEILWPQRGPFSQASKKPCGMMGRHKMKKDSLVVFTEHYKNMCFFRGWEKQTFSIAGMNCLGMFVPTVWSSNSSLVQCSESRGSRTPMTFPYWPEPPVCFLWVKLNLKNK